ncbi:MAG: hypothetical protein AAGJ46_10110 [Planctomycetota bacterium]
MRAILLMAMGFASILMISRPADAQSRRYSGVGLSSSDGATTTTTTTPGIAGDRRGAGLPPSAEEYVTTRPDLRVRRPYYGPYCVDRWPMPVLPVRPRPGLPFRPEPLEPVHTPPNRSHFMAGTDDSFNGPSEPSTLSEEFLDRFTEQIPGLNVFDFDLIPGRTTPGDGLVGATFDDLPSNIVAARLAFRARAGTRGTAGGNISLAEDSFWLGFTNPTGWTVAYARRFGDSSDGVMPTSPGSVEYFEDGSLERRFSPGFVGGEWLPGDSSYITLDLAALPLELGGTRSILDELNAAGHLDFFVIDDTSVDFAVLQVVTDAAPAPEPTGIASAAALAAGAAFRRRRGQA